MTEKEKKNCTNHENVVEETPKDKKGVIVWIKAHRKQLILVGISIPTIIAVTFRVKNKDALKALWQDLNEEIKKANMYSTKWFATVSDDVLDNIFLLCSTALANDITPKSMFLMSSHVNPDFVSTTNCFSLSISLAV